MPQSNNIVQKSPLNIGKIQNEIDEFKIEFSEKKTQSASELNQISNYYYQPKFFTKNSENKEFDQQLEEQYKREVNIFEQHDKGQFELIIRTILISLPNVFSFASLWILNFSNLKVAEIFKNEDYISAYAMSFMWGNALGYALITCLNNGLQVMAAQAIGSKQFNLVSVYYQRSQILNFIALIFLTGLLIKTDFIFSFFCTPEVSKYSQEFINGYIPSLYFYVIFDSTRSIFNSYKLYSVPNYLLLFTYSIHFIWIYLFMKYMDFGMLGLGMGRSVTEFLNMAFLLLVLNFFGFFKNIDFMWTKQAFQNLWGYLKFSIPMGSILYLDWIASDLQTIFVAGLKDKSQLAGHSAFVSIFLLYVVCSLGLSITIVSFIGQAIGKKDVAQCRKIMQTGFLTSFFISGMISFISYLLEDFSADLFTNTPGTRQNFLKCYKIFNYITIHGTSLQQIMGALLRSSANQNKAFFVPLTGYFILGIPFQYLITFYFDYQLVGTWVAYTFSVYFSAIIYTYYVLNLNWNKSIAQVQNILDQQNLKINEKSVSQIYTESSV